MTGSLRRGMLAAALILFAPPPARAHDPGLSSLELSVLPREIVAVLTIAAGDAAAIASPDTFALGALDLRVDTQPLRRLAGDAAVEAGRAVRVRARYERLPGARLTVRSDVPRALGGGHRQLLTIRDEGGAAIGERMLDEGAGETSVDLAAPRGTGSAARFFRVGLEHMLAGYDHLLFLAGLLLVVRSARDLAALVTAFTAAHAIALAAAAADLAQVPPRIVEPAIAASIVYVGMANLLRRDVRHRWQLTFGFGLVHGLGFASALGDLGAGAAPGEVAVRLAAFNAGVEAGQIAVALLALPILRRLERTAAIGMRLAPACSIAVALCGVYWLIQRTASAL